MLRKSSYLASNLFFSGSSLALDSPRCLNKQLYSLCVFEIAFVWVRLTF